MIAITDLNNFGIFGKTAQFQRFIDLENQCYVVFVYLNSDEFSNWLYGENLKIKILSDGLNFGLLNQTDYYFGFIKFTKFKTKYVFKMKFNFHSLTFINTITNRNKLINSYDQNGIEYECVRIIE